MGEKRGAIFREPDWLVRAKVGVLWGVVRIVRALPIRWMLAVADAAASVLYVLNRRARSVAHQNLRVAFGDDLVPAEAKRIAKAAMRESTRSVMLLLCVHPFDAERLADWIDVGDDALEAEGALAVYERGGILVSGHVGNWEFLVAIGALLPRLPEIVFVAETIPNAAVNEVLLRLRGHAGVVAAMRRGSVLRLVRGLKQGKVAGILADRNVRRSQGGIYSPFLGVPARTTPAPAWLAVRTGKPMVPCFLIPHGNRRYRLWVGPNLNQGLPEGSVDEQVKALTDRLNHVITAVVRAAPESWNWTLKRFKSRPTEALGPYPAYSRYDPDPEPDA